MFQTYSLPKSTYFVVTKNERVVGGGGFAPLIGGEPHTCELRKMYFLPETRGQGLGQQILEHCLKAAKASGFTECYLETLAGMEQAQKLYQKNGFEILDAPMGATGHFSCNRWYLKKFGL